MAKDDKELAVAAKENYTFQMLLNDIQNSAVGDDEDALAGDKAARERQSKLIVMQMLIDRANEYSNESHRDDGKLRNAIDVKVNNNVLLAGFIFFVSQNPQFDYSWNYLRKRENSYKEFLVEGIRFLNNVLEDINMLAGKPRTHKDVHIVMNDIIDVSLIGEKPFVKVSVMWENFHRLATVKKNYIFTVKTKECILVAGKRKDAADAEKLIDAALAMLNNTKGSSE